MDDLISRADAISGKMTTVISDQTIEVIPVSHIQSLSSANEESFEWCTDCKEYDQEQHCCHRWSKVIRETIEEFKKEYVGEWIPCSEKMPEEPFGCLVTVWDTNPVTMDEFENILPYFVGWDGEQWNDAEGEQCPFEVIAWMPLPEPYKGGES